MAGNSDLALIGANGVAYVGPVGSTAPIDAIAAPAAAFKDLGWISDDGLTEGVDESQTSFTPWGSLSPIKSVTTSSTKTFQVTFWETSPAVLGLYFRNGTDITVGAEGTFSFPEKVALQDDERAVIFDTFYGDNHLRLYCPRAVVSDRGSLVYKSDSIVGYQCTFSVYPGTDGVLVHRFGSIAGLAS